MMQGLVLLPNILGSQPGCHRLHALTLARQKQSPAIVLQGSFPIGVPGGLRQAIPIRRKALFSWAWRRRCGAHKNSIPYFCLLYNIVIHGFWMARTFTWIGCHTRRTRRILRRFTEKNCCDLTLKTGSSL